VTARVTPINPARDANLMPGDLTTIAGSNVVAIESFGAMVVTLSDAQAAPVSFASGRTSVIRIPVGSRTPSAALRSSVPLYVADRQTGR
jgi:hypothetical protein